MLATGEDSEFRASRAPAPWVDTVVLAGAFLLMFAWSCGKWPDVLVDFGRELYVPWRISQRQVLYRDVESFFGPLSPYVNAVFFKLFGVGLRTLALCNAAITALLCYWMYQVLLHIAGRLAAFAGCLLFIILFAFIQILETGNYNFISPYSHEAMHGVVLSVAGVFCLMRYQRGRGGAYLGISGLALGMVFLTKPEPFVAAAPAMLGGLVAWLWLTRTARRTGARIVLVFVFAALLPVFISFLLLRTAMPTALALHGTFGAWTHLADSELQSLVFYRRGMGTDDVWLSVGKLVIAAGWFALVLGPAAVLAWSLRRGAENRRAVIWAAVFASLGLLAGLLLLPRLVPDIARPLPIVLLVAAAVNARTIYKGRGTACDSACHATQLAMIIFALLLLAKIFLYARIYHYGFVLAMPATMVLVAALVGWVPSWLAARGASAAVFRAAALLCLAAITAAHVRVSHYWFAQKNFKLGDGPDALFTDAERGPVVDAALRRLNAMAHSGDTLAALPEGVMLNYLSRIPSSVPYVNYLPPELIMFGEARMLEALRSHPPTFIALVYRPTVEYGLSFFGTDYGRQLRAWIDRDYEVVDELGAAPLKKDGRFGITLLRRRDGGIGCGPAMRQH